MTGALVRPLDVLFEAPGLPAFELPAELTSAYGGTLGFAPPRLYASLVAGLDGVPSDRPGFGGEHCRFVTGLLRACADAVLVSSDILQASPRTGWTAEDAYPPAADLYARLRRLRGLPPRPTLAMLGDRGAVDVRHPRLRERTLDPFAAVEALHADGHELILCEGGPGSFVAFLRAGLVDELFLTLSPVIDGRLLAGQDQPLPEETSGTLLSLRRGESHLFLRYRLDNSERTRR